MLDWIGKLAAASALNPATPATAVVGSAGVIPMAVGLAGVSAAWYGGLLLGSMMKAGVIKASCGLQGAMAFLRHNGIYDIQAIENVIIQDMLWAPRLWLKDLETLSIH